MEYTHEAYPPSPTPRRQDSGRSMSSSGRAMSAEIEHVVTRLLRTTKTLLEALTQWSQLAVSTAQIIDIQEVLEQQFYQVTQAFAEANVPISDLGWIPGHLRESVKSAMEQPPSTAALDQYLPRIRDVIVHLLHGLKGKQQYLREKDHRTESWHSSVPPAALARASHPRSYAMNGNGATSPPPFASSFPYNGTASPPPAPPPPPPSGRLTPSEYDLYQGMPRPSLSSETRVRYPYPQRTGSMTRPYSSSSQIAGQTVPISPSSVSSAAPPPTKMPSPSRSTSSNRSLSGRYPQPSTVSIASLVTTTGTASISNPHAIPASPPLPPPPLTPPTMPLHHLHHHHSLHSHHSLHHSNSIGSNSSSSNNNSNSNSPSPPHNNNNNNNTSATMNSNITNNKPPTSFDESDPHTASALAALKRQENLARRSSVRRASMFRTDTKRHQDYTTLAPPLPPVPALPQEPKLSSVPEDTPTGITLYLQIAKEVKKVQYGGDISIPALHMLFLEKFGYTSRQNDFPSIYIRDPTVLVFYQLEHLEEVVNRSVLMLNLDEQDQEQKRWKEGIVQMISKALKDNQVQLQQGLESVKKQTETKPQSLMRDMVHKMMMAEHRPVSTANPATGKAVAEEKAVAVVQGLSPQVTRQQLGEVESLKRDMAVLRQLQGEMRDTTATVLDHLRKKAEEVRQTASESTEPVVTTHATARQFVEQGKQQLLTDSDKITARLEDLQDTIDQLKLDVTLRKSRPSEAQMTHCAEETKALAQEIEQFGQYIVKVKPTWKKTWEQELQTIVKEQQSLKEQEGLLLDMKDDLAALLEVYEQLEKICVYQAKARPVVREFRVAPAEEGFQGMSSVLKQVTTIDVDHDRRLKALEQSEKMRQREQANRVDDFEKELGDFVGARKLKKTGGAMEMDRIREQKDKDLLKAMYNKKNGSVNETEQGEAPSTPSEQEEEEVVAKE
ncbi:actin interacting protein 3-domain-containing protein [Spinellus fusiger]|nr:actin interacting protein 3-domain-containing protein [Spinellus fusiger]